MSGAPQPKGSGRYQVAMQQLEYARHRQRVEKQRSCIDTATPKCCEYRRPIREPGEGAPSRNYNRQHQIEHDNQKLVERMVHIMQTGGSVDNKEPWRDSKRLEYSQRRRNMEQQRIAQENAKLLERLEKTQPSYRADKFEADRTRNEAIAARISQYPYQPLDRSQ